MTDYKELPADTDVTEIASGDRLTIAQPREGETLTLFANQHEDGRLGVILADEFMDISRLLGRGLKIVRVDRPIPEVVLPTEPGYYESAEFPLSSGHYAYRLNSAGRWYDGSTHVAADYMRELMPLTRLVPEAAPAKLADRLDPYKVGRLAERLYENDGSSLREDGIVLIAAIDNGELDK